MRTVVIAALFCVASIEANAQAIGLGGRPCSQFAKDYLESHEIAEPLYFTYAQGYMTALNMLFSTLKKHEINLTALSIEKQKEHIRQFCIGHPDAAYVFAVQNLFETLQKLSP